MPLGNANLGNSNIGGSGGNGITTIPSSVQLMMNFLFKYIPKFVTRNDFLTELVFRLAVSLADLRMNIYALVTICTSGATGQKYADQNVLYLSYSDDDNALRNDILATITIQKARGTQNGILADVMRLCNDPTASMTYFAGEDVGWWLDVTYPDVAQDGTYDETERLTCIDVGTFLEIIATNAGRRTSSEIENIINRAIVPINVATEIILT